MYLNNFRKIKPENHHRISMQNIKSEIRNKIICKNINTKIIKTITLILGHNFLDLTTPNNRKLKKNRKKIKLTIFSLISNKLVIKY